MTLKEQIDGRHYERGLLAAQSSSTSFRTACKCFARSPTHADLTLFAKPFKFVHFCLLNLLSISFDHVSSCQG